MMKKLRYLFTLLLLAVAGVTWAATEKTITVAIKGYGGSTTSGYVNSNTKATIDDVDFYAYAINRSNGQIRGNKTSIASSSVSDDANKNFHLYNGTAIPGNITKIVLKHGASGNNKFQNKMYAATGTSAQGDVTAVTGATEGTLASDGSSFTWTFNASAGITYFKLLSNAKFTANSVTGAEITITYEAADETPSTEVGKPVFTVERQFNGGTKTYEGSNSNYILAGDVLTITATNADKIYYRTDGSSTVINNDGTPFDENTHEYTGPITLTSDDLIFTAYGVKNDGTHSAKEGLVVFLYKNLTGSGTEADPFTVPDAYWLLNDGRNAEGVCVKGIVSEIVTAYNSTYGNISYNISSDGSTDASQLQAFRGKSYNGDNFTSADDIQVGDKVVVKGNLTIYGSTKEFATDNQLVSLERDAVAEKKDAELSVDNVTVKVDETPTLTVNTKSDGALTFVSSDDEVATVEHENDGSYAIYAWAAGTATITVTQAETDEYKEATTTFTVTVTEGQEEPTTEGRFTFVPTSTSAGDLTNAPEGVTAEYSSTYGTKFQLTANNSMTLTIKGMPSNYKVTGITLDVKNNASKGNGTATASIGQTVLGTMTITGLGNTYQEKAMEITPAMATSDLVITIAASENSVYCDKFIIDYEITDDVVKQDAGISWEPTTLTITEGEEFEQPTFNNPNNVFVIIESDNEEVAVWDEQDNELVLMDGIGTANITATFAGNDDYNPATATLTVTVNKKQGEEPTEGTVYYVKISDESELTSGDYLIVYEEGNLAMNGGLTDKLDAVGNSIEVTIADGVITATDAVNAAAFTYDATAKTLKGAGGLYMGQTSDANGLASDASKTYENTITFDEDGNADIVSGGAYLRYNAANNQTRFRYYKSSSYTNQKAIQLYRKLVFDVEIGATGYATLYYADYDLVVPEGVEAYTYTITDGKLEESYMYEAGEVIPASTGVVLKGAQGTYTFVPSQEDGLVDEANLLRGFDTDEEYNEPGYKYYILSKSKDGSKVGFYFQTEGGTSVSTKAHKAFLAVPTEVAGEAKGWSFDGEATAISSVGVDGIDTNATAAVYDLQGRKMAGNAKLPKGLYIVNGKKVVVK